eukprot:SAG11_NODE_2012_length_3924_cov_1.906667_5_plen_77_part_00
MEIEPLIGGLPAWRQYTGGFLGSFADVNAFFGGLAKLIGDPDRDVLAVRRKHIETIMNDLENCKNTRPRFDQCLDP